MASRGENLVGIVMEFIKQGPFFFYDILSHFEDKEYPDLLVAWSAIRALEKFKRDDEGRYILIQTTSQ